MLKAETRASGSSVVPAKSALRAYWVISSGRLGVHQEIKLAV